MSGLSPEAIALVPSIYETAVQPERWTDTLVAVRRFVGGTSSMFSQAYLVSGRGEVFAADALDPETLAAWERRHGLSPWTRGALAMEVGEVRPGHTMVPLEVLRETRLWHELLEPLGIRDMLGLVVSKSPLVIGGFTFYDSDPYEPPAIERLAELAPHLVRATALRNRVAWLSQRAAAFESGIERLPVGVALVDARGDVLHSNARAQALFEERDGIAIEAGRIGCADRAAQAALVRALAAACDPTGPAAAPVLVPRPSLRRPLHLLVSPSHDRSDPAAEPAALVWVHDPEQTPVPTPEALEQLFGLSPAEARMAAAIASGASVREHAVAAGITEGTARWRLKRVLEKAGARTQADLVRLVLGSLPGLA